MRKFLDIVSDEASKSFVQAGYDADLGKVSVSNRPDLCEFQCNGAMAGAKRYKKPPMAIAEEVAAILAANPVFIKAEAVSPGFINLDIDGGFLLGYIKEMREHDKFGAGKIGSKTVIIDYGGPNVAKPLHVGHLRSAVIGESVKRIMRFMGDNVTGDIHLGDWGLQMGLIIAELSERQPELPYFDEGFTGDYPLEPPFTIDELEEIYPTASTKSKGDELYRKKAADATRELQNGRRGYRALWNHIINVSKNDLRQNYDKLNIEFDLWNGESDVQDIIPVITDELRASGLAYESEGALVIDVKEESDAKEMPPCIILKSDGAALYSTTDIATLKQRMDTAKPDEVIYVVDKRQSLHFEQVFRASRKAGIVPDNVALRFLGFGTMNGKDGKPFKTREGGIMRLEDLIKLICDEMLKKIIDNRTENADETSDKAAVSETDIATADIIALSALKYGDLSNQATKDYIFDMDRFTSFEGDTGPYVLYTIVRIKSILRKYRERGGDEDTAVLQKPVADSDKKLMLELVKFSAIMEDVYRELAPHKLCFYIFILTNTFNMFYHGTKILIEKDKEKKLGYIALLNFTKDVLETSVSLLGFNVPDKM